MAIEKIEVRGTDKGKEILEKLTLLDAGLRDLDVSLAIMQTDIASMKTDITKIKDDVAAKP